MKKMNFWLLASLFAGAVAFTACSSSDDSTPTPGPSVPGSITPGNPVNPTTMKMAALSGFVYDQDGNALSGVKVTSGTEEVTTGRDGGFMLSKVNSVNGRTVVDLSKSGYVDVVRSMETKAGAIMEVVMANEWGANTASDNYASSNPRMLNPGAMSIDLQGDGYKDNSTGAAFTGYVNAKALYLNPDDESFAAMMPGGDLAAVRNAENGNEQVQLVSYGMTKVDLTDYSGNKLNLADGKPATLRFPIPEKFKDNPEPSMPLWSFNEATGLWEEEGVATLVGDHYEGTVTHFSWVNLDYPERRATLKIIVKDNQGNAIPNVKVDIDGQRQLFTDVNGEGETNIPINQNVYATVHSVDYGNYEPEVKVDIPAVSPAGTTKTIEIILTHLAHLSGQITNTGNGSNFATLWIDYDGKQTKKVHSDADGKFYMLCPDGYTGEATLKVRANDGTLSSYTITLDGQDHAFNISISTGAESGGTVTATLKENSKAYNFTVPTVSYEDFYGVSIIDNMLNCNASAGEYPNSSSYYITISDYSPATTQYNGITFSFSESSGNNYMYVSDFNNNGERSNQANVTINSDGLYRIQITGDAGFNGNGIQGGNQANATIKADVTAPLLAKGKNLGKITAKDASFPSFTPWLNGKKTTACLQITESPRLGKGVMAGFLESENQRITYADYLSLKTQAQSQLGKPVECGDFENDPTATEEMKEQNMSFAAFAKGDKFIMISYCGWNGRMEGEGEEEFGFYSIGELKYLSEMCRLSFIVLDGMMLDYNVLMEGSHHWRTKGDAGKGWEPVWKNRRK